MPTITVFPVVLIEDIIQCSMGRTNLRKIGICSAMKAIFSRCISSLSEKL